MKQEYINYCVDLLLKWIKCDNTNYDIMNGFNFNSLDLLVTELDKPKRGLETLDLYLRVFDTESDIIDVSRDLEHNLTLHFNKWVQIGLVELDVIFSELWSNLYEIYLKEKDYQENWRGRL